MYMYIPECCSSGVVEESSLWTELHHRIEQSGVYEEEQVGIETGHYLKMQVKVHHEVQQSLQEVHCLLHNLILPSFLQHLPPLLPLSLTPI
jgi:hypothetical protein